MSPGQMNPPALSLPHGLKPRYELGVDWMQVAVIAGAVILCAVAAWVIWKWWQRRQAARLAELAAGAGDAGPGRVAGIFETLRGLKPAEPFDTRAREEFYWRLGLAFRTAVEWRTGISATSQTIRELREPLRKRLPLPGKETAMALELLERSEGIKFAGDLATPSEALAARDATVKLIAKLFPGEGRNEGLNAGRGEGRNE